MTDMAEFLYIRAEDWRDVKSAYEGHKKIKAIKILRKATNCGLKEAKFALERWSGLHNEGPIIRGTYDILDVTIRTPDGDITVDMENLQLTGLMTLNTMGLDTCRSLLSLHDSLLKWREQMGGKFFSPHEEENKSDL